MKRGRWGLLPLCWGCDDDDDDDECWPWLAAGRGCCSAAAQKRMCNIEESGFVVSIFVVAVVVFVTMVLSRTFWTRNHRLVRWL